MSWCRWSSELENGQAKSDLYIYDSVNDCITVHVAGRRRKNYADAPPQPNYNILKESIETYMAMGKAHNEWLDKNGVWENLPDEYSGKTYDFGYDEIDSLTEFLKKARMDGINFPEYVFDIVSDYVEERDGEQV